MIKVSNEVETRDDVHTTPVRVHSHWNDPDLVVLVIGDEKRTVSASDLIAAVKNASNTNRHG
ncbi:hypothetical protein [Klebsiella pneumoniae]|uniref:hypothetical protein n=1 Tax=Klebsiella pneumoniae TaxID=573 RepID=UPI0034D1A2F8